MDYYNNDDFIVNFEQRICSCTGFKYAVAVDSCTNALLLSAVVSIHNKEDTIIEIPKHTYISVPMTLLLHGFHIRFIHHTWRDCYKLGNTKIWDCSNIFDSSIRSIVKPDDYACVSFQQKKKLGIGKGGAILLNNQDTANLLRRLRHDGRDSGLSYSKEVCMFPDEISIGYHMNMTPDEACKGILLLNQLRNKKQPDTVVRYMNYPDISTLSCFKNHPRVHYDKC